MFPLTYYYYTSNMFQIYNSPTQKTCRFPCCLKVNAVNNHQQTALHLAVWDPDALQLLLQHKADVNAADENGTTPLMAALEEDEPEPLAVKYLLDAKVQTGR